MKHAMTPIRRRSWLILGALLALLASCAGPGDALESDPGDDGGGVVIEPPDPCISAGPGALDCECLSNDTCDGDLRCVEGTCETCPPGEEGCGCTGGVLCQGELVCMDGLCMPDTCEEGEIDCPCRAPGDTPRCDDDAYCTEAGACAECASDVAGCPCEAGVCGDGLVCGDDDSCREAMTCSDLRDAGLCGPHQLCEDDGSADPAATINLFGDDAYCVPETCEEDYQWNPVLEGCVPDASCVPGVPGSIAGQCGSENRACVEQEGDDACGDCLPGTELIDGACLPQIDCGGETCGLNQYCDRLDGDGPTCRDWPCPEPNQVVDTLGLCSVTCTRSCDFEGSTGRYWPYADNEDSCVCETRPGYFWLKGQDSVPEKCDADFDGWVRDEVRSELVTGPNPIPALAQNMRCDIRTVDRIALRDEYGLRANIHSCEEGLIKDAGECAVVPIRLLESKRNDVPEQLAIDPDTPAYGGHDGRRLRAKELNALTKACVSSTGDFNDDGVEDIDEVQNTQEDTSGLGEASRLQSFAYYVELQAAWYEQDEGEQYGRLVIAERSRCDGDFFPLGYDDLQSYDPGQPGSYWRSCTRRRDPSFDAEEQGAGNDFAQWSCDTRHGSCPVTPPAHPEKDASAGLDPDVDLLRDHGLCELGGATPADGVWRGMNHHSQFKCVAVSPADPGLPRHWATPEEFDGSGTLVMNDCRAESCADEVDCVESRRNDERDASHPIVRCVARSSAERPEAGEVGWAAVRYQPYGHIDDDGEQDDRDYAGSCINEDAEWLYDESADSGDSGDAPREFLCPFPEFGRLAEPATDAFGRFRCHGWDAFFLWAGPEETPDDFDRPSLLWASSDGEPTPNASMWR